jgi:thymidylate synthase (FAD)
MLEFIGKFNGHKSPLEHVQITIHISGISRALSHQLVRHRIASYSQMSQRYVNNKPDFIVPPSI